MKTFLKLIRVQHYVKNIFVLAPSFFAFDFSESSIMGSFTAFVLFSITASSIYIFNDIQDINEDSKHPLKRLRPIASGEISRSLAYLYCVSLALISFLISFIYSKSVMKNFDLVMILSFYFLLNIAYSKWLKHYSLIDVFIISVGFVLRIYAGSAATNINLSIWIQLITFLLALFLAFAKRREDVILSSSGRTTRKNIIGYNLEFVNTVMVFLSTIIVVCYLQYCMSDSVVLRFNSNKIYLTSLFLILGILRYFQITFVENNSGNPTSILIKDRSIQLSILMWLLSILYFYFT